MKAVYVTQHLFARLRLRSAGTTLLLLALFTTSCQKEQMPSESTEKNLVSTFATPRTSVLEQNVVQHLQWSIDHFVPLIADADVYAAIESGNTTSAVVTAQLATLGFSSFEQFAQAYHDNGAAVFAAIQSGALSDSEIQQIAGSHAFNLDVLGDDPPAGASLPCTDQFASTMAMMPIVVAAATTLGSPAAGTIAGALYTANAYRTYKSCMRSNYPQG